MSEPASWLFRRTGTRDRFHQPLRSGRGPGGATPSADRRGGPCHHPRHGLSCAGADRGRRDDGAVDQPRQSAAFPSAIVGTTSVFRSSGTKQLTTPTVSGKYAYHRAITGAAMSGTVIVRRAWLRRRRDAEASAHARASCVAFTCRGRAARLRPLDKTCRIGERSHI